MKASRIMIRPLMHLASMLTDPERDVLRKVLIDNIRGVDREHDKRWRRFVGTLINSQPDEITEFINPRTRSLPFHKRWMAIERAVFENQDGFVHVRRFRDWLKTGAGWGKYEPTATGLVFVPGSVSFDEASDDEMREFVKAAEEFLHTPHAQKKLWPHLPAARRSEMVDTLLRESNQHEEHS
jgi:hypothetical protein